MGKAQGLAKCNKDKGHQCKKKTLVVQKSREKKKLNRKTRTEGGRRRKRVSNRKNALDCRVLLTRLDSDDTKESSKKQKRRAKIKQGTKCDEYRQRDQASLQVQEPEMIFSPASVEFSWEPRRRRMAALNAEAVNSLLLFRENPQSVSRKQQLPTDNPKQHTPEHKGNKTKTPAQKDKNPHKSKKDLQDQSIDWLSLLAPTPRRQAGLTAATLLKLTSAQYTNKRQKKKEVKQETGAAEAIAQSDSQRKSDDRSKSQHKEQLKDRERSRQADPAPQGCSVCALSHTVEPEWSSRDRLKPPVQKPPILSFSPKVKEEQLESQVSSCYCCTQEQCVQYCHRLALFLRDKSFQGQDGSLSSVFHHHHHHHHLPALGTHSYTCFPGYYFHVCHPSDSQDHVYPHSTKRAKLLGAQSSGTPGISHPLYCCTSVEHCFDPCTISGYQVIPAMGCTKCSHTVKKEEYPSTLSDLHSPTSLSSCPSPRVLTACPNPPVPPAGQSEPPPSEPHQPAATLPLDQKCPQTSKAPRIFPLVSRATKDKKRAPPAANGGRSVPKKWRHKSTNGWQPVGLSYQREVFSVGEETLVPRTCFEAVQRDGDVVQVRDTVLLKSGPRKKCLPYVAKVSALWEDPDSGELMMSLFWYYRPEHTQGGRKPDFHCENEIFASRHQDVNSVACIEDKCYVLPVAQYCRFRALVKRQQEGRGCSSLVPPAVEHGLPSHHCVPQDVDPELVFFCRHVYDFRFGRLLKNLQ